MRLFRSSLTVFCLLPLVSGEVEETSGEESARLAVPLSCREVIFNLATDPVKCSLVPRSALGFNSTKVDEEKGWEIPNVENTPENSKTHVWNQALQMWVKTPIQFVSNTRIDDDSPGSCRWDFQRANVLSTDQACLCPATERSCGTQDKCWWYEVPDKNSEQFTKYACLNNAERFYYLLQKLLKKRGKNDFAINLKYGSAGHTLNPFMNMDSGLLQRIMMMRMMTQMMQRNSGSSSYNNYNQGYYYSPADSSNNYNQGYYSNSNNYNGYNQGVSGK